MAIGLIPTPENEKNEEDRVSPLEPRFPYEMIPFPLSVAGVEADPPKKTDLNSDDSQS